MVAIDGLSLLIGVILGFLAGGGVGILFIQYTILTTIRKILKSIEVESARFKEGGKS